MNRFEHWACKRDSAPDERRDGLQYQTYKRNSTTLFDETDSGTGRATETSKQRNDETDAERYV